jgi:L-lactate dehydrogenase (cytochrome)
MAGWDEAGADQLPERSVRALARLGDARERALSSALDLDDFQRLARPKLPRAVYGYVANGAEAMVARDNNRSAFGHWRMVTRVLRDVSRRSQETTLFGRRYAAPFGIAPMGASAVVAYDADNRMARAAREAGIPFVLSANAITPLEELARTNPDAWFAAYQSPDHGKIERMLGRVEAAGYDVYCLTVDVPVGSNRVNDKRAGYSMPLRPTPRLAWDGLTHPRWLAGTFGRTFLARGRPEISNVEATGRIGIFSRQVAAVTGHPDFGWREAELIRKLWRGKFVIKGLLSAEDARIARELGADGVVVSNHGGRQLDAAVTPLEVLPEIRQAAGDGMAVLCDSGFRHGTDVLKALALGADFVLIGRPFLFAAAAAGLAGVRHAVGLLGAEVERDMALLGVDRTGSLRPELLCDAHPRLPAGGAARGLELD